MSAREEFDILILGSGQGGKLLAWHMARSGCKTAVVERRWIGGSCPNIACMPSKNEVWSARIAHLAHQAAEFGTNTGAVSTDMAKVRQRKRDMVDREVKAHLENFAASGAELILGSGRFVAPKTVEVQLNGGGKRVLSGDRVFLNLGSHAAIPDVPGLEAARPLTHIELLELDRLPSHLIVLGGGYVGIEMAQAYRRFGSDVTIIEPSSQVMGREDADVSALMQQILGYEGVRILLSAETLSVQGRSGEGVLINVRTPRGEHTIEGSDILVAAGRVPNTAGIGLEQVGVELGDRGTIRVNDRLETTAPDVWAIGECAGSPQFTHISVDDFRIIRDNLDGKQRCTRDRLVPYCVFTDPPLARVGLNEREAARGGVSVRTAKLPAHAVLRTETTGESQGFMKALVADDDRILGFTMIGSEAGEVMAAVQMAMLANLPYPRVAAAVIAHLTMAEGLGLLFSSVPPQGAHELNQ
jgi:pyruvate/2-oxoglutarate dehydrogenase complex dihydrolipoamide dehydrogenase (E3) component